MLKRFMKMRECLAIIVMTVHKKMSEEREPNRLQSQAKMTEEQADQYK
jgi:hypothetical protein